METGKTSVAIGVRHPVTLQLVELLHTESGDRLTDEFFHEATGLDYTQEGSTRDGFGRSLLRSAMNICRWEHGISWERDFGSGSIVREDAAMARNSTGRALKSTKRMHRKELRRLQCTGNGNLEPTERAQHNALFAQVGTIAALADTRAHKKLTARNVQAALDMPKLLEAFGAAKG